MYLILDFFFGCKGEFVAEQRSFSRPHTAEFADLASQQAGIGRGERQKSHQLCFNVNSSLPSSISAG